MKGEYLYLYFKDGGYGYKRITNEQFEKLKKHESPMGPGPLIGFFRYSPLGGIVMQKLKESIVNRVEPIPIEKDESRELGIIFPILKGQAKLENVLGVNL